MARRLPPLNALRAFEAAARHLSFTEAAQELNVTQAAISHQIKSLEEHLGTALFLRMNRALALTDAGERYYPPLRQALDLMDVATRDLVERDAMGPLKVTVLPSFAARWLLPRLADFRQEHPEIDVLISADDELVDFSRAEADIGIRYGRGDYPGLETDFLMGDRVFPVCSPKLIDGDPPLRKPEDLVHHTLLHDDVLGGEDSPDWALWLKRAGLENLDIDPRRGPGFNDSAMQVQAAVDGQGVALARSALTLDDLKAGRLVCPFGPEIKSRLAYYLVSPPSVRGWRKVKIFRDWLMARAEADRAEGEALRS